MNQKWTAFALSGALLCTLSMPALAAESAAVPISAPLVSEVTDTMPDSVLYYGKVEAIVKNESGTITQLRMSSDRYGEYIMNISDKTVWIDSGNRTKSDPSTLQEGESLYVFHSVAETMSLPPQSAALAVVRNIPMDAGCAQYHEVEAISKENGQWRITTDHGGLFLLADDKTELSRYTGEETLSLDDIQVGDSVMAWYGAVAESYPAQAHVNHLMLLPGERSDETEQTTALTRAEAVCLLYEQAGKPVVNYAMDYTDVDGSAEYAEAIRWAASEGIVSGYGNRTFGPEDPITREQFAVMLYRYAQKQGEGFTGAWAFPLNFADAGEVSDYAYEAMCWMTMKEIMGDVGDNTLAPKGEVTGDQATAILTQFMNALSA